MVGAHSDVYEAKQKQKKNKTAKKSLWIRDDFKGGGGGGGGGG